MFQSPESDTKSSGCRGSINIIDTKWRKRSAQMSSRGKNRRQLQRTHNITTSQQATPPLILLYATHKCLCWRKIGPVQTKIARVEFCSQSHPVYSRTEAPNHCGSPETPCSQSHRHFGDIKSIRGTQTHLVWSIQPYKPAFSFMCMT